jgi:MFS family permease
MTTNATMATVDTMEETRQGPAPGARLALALLLSINLFNYIDRQVLAAVEPQIRAELLPDDENAKTKTGFLSTAFLLTYMLISPLFGWLGDRFSRWWLIAIGVILWSLASGASGMPWHSLLLVPISTAFVYLLITRCFVGIGEAAYGPVAPTIISDLYPVKVRGGVLSWFYAAIPVGSALGYTLGGIVVNNLHLEWRWAFYLVVPPGILLGLLCLFMREPTRGQADEVASESEPSARRVGLLKEYAALLKIRSWVYDTLGMTAMTFALGGLAYWMPAYLIERKAEGIGPLDPVTAFGAIVVLAGFAATLLGGWLGDRMRSKFPGAYFLVSGVGMIIGFFGIGLVLITPFPDAWIAIFLAVFFLFFNTGPSNTILANVTHPSIRATAFAVNIFIIHALGDAISPPAIGWISDRAKGWVANRPDWLPESMVGFLSEYAGMNAGFFVVSVMTLVGGVIWLWGARYLEHDTQMATQPLHLE